MKCDRSRMRKQGWVMSGIGMAIVSGWPMFLLAQPVPSSVPAPVTKPATNLPTRNSGNPDLIASIKVVEIDPVPAYRRRQRLNEARNYDGTWQAYDLPGQKSAIVVVEDLTTRKTFQIQGLPPSFRSFSHFIWIDGYKISFERWSNPQFGYRYTIDMKLKQAIEVATIAAAPIKD